MTLLFVYLFLALGISFLCSIMETVLLSTPASFLHVKTEEKFKWAVNFSQFKTDIDKPLSAILSLNTVAHTIGAAGVGAQAVKVFGEASFGVASGILTILILIVTEIIPKTVGARYWRSLAKPVSYLIHGTILVSYPLVIMASLITRMFGKNNDTPSTSREEIAALTSLGTSEGVFSANEHRIIQNVLKLKNIRVNDILTPRIVVAAADETQELETFLTNKDYLSFSRIPVFHETIDKVTGYVLRESVFEYLAEDKHKLKLKDIKREIITVPEASNLLTLWEKMLDSKEHIAVVVDEYGGMEGVVTLEDIIETLLGLEIMDEKDTIKDMQAYAKNRWRTRQAKYNRLMK